MGDGDGTVMIDLLGSRNEWSCGDIRLSLSEYEYTLMMMWEKGAKPLTLQCSCLGRGCDRGRYKCREKIVRVSMGSGRSDGGVGSQERELTGQVDEEKKVGELEQRNQRRMRYDTTVKGERGRTTERLMMMMMVMMGRIERVGGVRDAMGWDHMAISACNLASSASSSSSSLLA